MPVNLYSRACFLQAEVEQAFQIAQFSFFKVFDGFGDVLVQAGGGRMTGAHIPKARLKLVKYFRDYYLI